MKHICNFHALRSILLIVILVILNNCVMAQVPSDTTKPKVDSTQLKVDSTQLKVDTAIVVVADTTHHAPAAAAAATTESGTNKKPKAFSIYGGGNSNSMSGSTDKYNANSGVGYHFGVAWEMGGFLYYQFGLRYNNAKYGFNSKVTSKDTGDLKVQALDLPATIGINFLSFAKIVSLRVFISAIPSFTLGVSDNHFGITKDHVNSFIFYGQAGIGANIAFVYVDLGYNYGTQSLMKNSVTSTNPGQAYLSLGIRF